MCQHRQGDRGYDDRGSYGRDRSDNRRYGGDRDRGGGYGRDRYDDRRYGDRYGGDRDRGVGYGRDRYDDRRFGDRERNDDRRGGDRYGDRDRRYQNDEQDWNSWREGDRARDARSDFDRDEREPGETNSVAQCFMFRKELSTFDMWSGERIFLYKLI